MQRHILIIEDEPRVASLLDDYLKRDGFTTSTEHNGGLAVDSVKRERPDLILLDLMLPEKDGMTICREIRAFTNTPIIMVTARVEEIDRLLGLELGADDYVSKPFSPREVVARVKAVLRRTSVEERQQGIHVDHEKYTVSIDSIKTSLTAVEFQLFAILFEQPGRIFSRIQLMDRIYPDQRVVTDRTIDSHIMKLRKKIAKAASERDLIHSVYGVGYKFE